MITTTTTTTNLINEQQQQQSSSSSSSSNSNVTFNPSTSSTTKILANLKLIPEEPPILKLTASTGSTIEENQLLNHDSAQQSKSSDSLLTSPKIGKWSEGSSYPSGFGIRIDSRSHLEVFDQKHRYGKNLRKYYKEWVKQKIDLQFFDWLNSPNLTELPECPRAALDEDIVFYCKSDADRENCLVRIGTNGKLYHRVVVTQPSDQENNSSSSSSSSSSTVAWKRLTTHGEGDGWIFVLKDNRIYAHEKITDQQPRFHHSSFFAGADVDAAGMFVVENGNLTRLFPHSGHYRPGEVHMYFLLHFLDTCGIDLKSVSCDAQRLAHVARQVSETGEKARKIDTPTMWSGDYMLNFLRSKKLFWDLKISAGIKSHPLFLKLSSSFLEESSENLTGESDTSLPRPPLPTLERRITNSIINTPSAPYYPSGTFGGGGIGKPLILIPAISTYPLTATLRDDLLSRVKNEQQLDPPPPSIHTTTEDLILIESSDPKDAGALSSPTG